jgi:hypothetical protein
MPESTTQSNAGLALWVKLKRLMFRSANTTDTAFFWTFTSTLSATSMSRSFHDLGHFDQSTTGSHYFIILCSASIIAFCSFWRFICGRSSGNTAPQTSIPEAGNSSGHHQHQHPQMRIGISIRNKHVQTPLIV